MGKQARKLKGRGAREARTFALLGLISLVISILAWSATPGAPPGAPPDIGI
jgi:hypothetical protein